MRRLRCAAEPEEFRAFFRDLCTPAEIQAMADRWAVVDYLNRGLPYREIHRLTGVSVTTIGRVARFLAAGNGGYAAAARQLGSASEQPVMDEPRLKFAVQKSGRLTEPSLDLLTRCGLKLSRGKDQLIGFGENMPLDVLFVRDDDIPDLVQEDVCDLGLVGLNVLEEKRLELGLARARRAVLSRCGPRFRALPAVACGPGDILPTKGSPRLRAGGSPRPIRICWSAT